jgi:glutamate-1-semialdehyde 2,1-aminomutase
MIALAARFTEGVAGVIKEFDLPWNITSLGCRTEYWFSKHQAHNGSEAAAAVDGRLDQYMHLAAMNRRILMTPFHNMALMSPKTTEQDVDDHTKVFRDSVMSIIS